MPDQPGRSCPVHYRYAPTVFATPAAVTYEVLYVVGACTAIRWPSTRCSPRLWGNPGRHTCSSTAISTGSTSTRRCFNAANHCYGCTAGAGSSCGGAVT
jgi:hypothetical protein